MTTDTIFIGFGEAGRAFGVHGAGAYDRKLETADRDEMRAAMLRSGMTPHDDRVAATGQARTVLSLVTADQVLAAAQAGAGAVVPGTYWLDMNSVAPATKSRAAAMIEEAGAYYVDVAVMAPVHPRRHATPLLVSGPRAHDAADRLAALGFVDVSVVGDTVGAASAIKMIRSVMVKGIEALSAECALAAARAGVLERVLASLDAGERSAGWVDRAGSLDRGGWMDRIDYNLDRMMIHGLRRAAEMDEVVATLDVLGTGSGMSRATAARQRAIGELRIVPDVGLEAKLAALSACPTGQEQTGQDQTGQDQTGQEQAA